MARKFKTYVTRIGFFELAVAAPSMKAALEAWGMARNAFHQGFAAETDDPRIIAAATAKPGIVLKRAVGSKGDFSEKAELPTRLPVLAPVRPLPKKPADKKKKRPARTAQNSTTADILSYEKARAARRRERAKQDAEQAKQAAAHARADEQRQAAVDRARMALDRAAERHDAKVQDIEKARRLLERRAAAEQTRWNKEKKKLEAGLRNSGR